MKRALLSAVVFSAVALLLVFAPVSFALPKTHAVITDHQFHFSTANKTGAIFKSDAHHRTANAESIEASKSAPFAQKKKAKAGLKSRANGKARRYTANPPTGKLGFVSAAEILTGGGTYWDAAKGDFNGDGNQDLVTIVQTDNSGTYDYALSILLGNGDGTFQSPVLTTITDSCALFVVGDVNGDKKDDILLVHIAGQCSNPNSSFDVLTSNGDGTLTQGANYAISANPLLGGGLYVTTNSGHLDLVAVDLPENSGTPTGPSNVVTVLGNGDGTFSANPTPVALSGQVQGPVLADLNGDGILDVAGVDYTTNQVTVYLATSTSAYASGVAYDTPDHVWDACNLTVGDLNGDGYPEIVTPNCYDENVTVFVNNKNGSYQPGVYYNVAVGGSGSAAAADYLSPAAVAIADVNGDGKPDIISTNNESADVTILTGNGDGTVNVPTVGYAAGGFPQTPAVVADFNGDGYPDLVLADDAFNLVFLKGYGDGTFRAALDYYAPIGNGGYYGQSKGIATGDFNGDGIPDFVVGGVNNISGLGGVNVFLSRPDGSLQPAVTYGSSSCDYFVAVADFNHDGKLDFATTDCNSNVQIFTGNGDGTFTAGNTFASGGSSPDDLVAADFNGDGYPDVAVINYNGLSNSSVGVLLNDGTGNLLTAVPYALSALTMQGIAASDVNGDGKADLVVPINNASGTGSVVGILLGNGDGTFQAEQDFALSAVYPAAVTVADVNGDGIPDILVTLDNGGGQDIAVLLGTSNPWGYQAPTYLASSLQDYNLNSPYPQYLKVVDVNGDGNPDLVYTNAAYGTVGILFGAGSGSFYDPVEYAAGENPWGLAVADVNGDGAPDVVTADEDFAGVTVLLNANGAATAGNYTVTASPTSATVTAGSNATFTLTVTPSNHYDGQVTFSCGTLPALAKCTFNPASVTLNGITPAMVALSISTTAPSTASVISHTGSAILFASIGGMGLFGLVFGFLGPCGPGRPRLGSRAKLALLGIVVLVVLSWTACGGSVNSTTTPPGKSQNPGTPSGTYTVTVTATGTAGTNNGNTSAHPVNLTLTVQ
jgi:hypothetical protein